jgi:hypothetical protein
VRRTSIATLAATGAVLAAAGCGGSSKSSSAGTGNGTASNSTTAADTTPKPTGPQLSRTQLIAKADAVCARVNKKRNSVSLSSPESYMTLLSPFAAYEKNAMAELARLNPPSSLKNNWEKFVRGDESVANTTSKLAQYAAEGNIKITQSLVIALNQTERQVTATAKHAGFVACASL